MLISEAYTAQNADMHLRKPGYGASGSRWAKEVRDLANLIKAESILDYGAGKRSLEYELDDLNIRSYDPCVPEIAGEPEPADLVACTDVLEHVEPECIDAVLDHIHESALKAVFLVIATRPATKTLPDGRNAHLIQQSSEWWLPKITQRWKLQYFAKTGVGEFTAIGVRR